MHKHLLLTLIFYLVQNLYLLEIYIKKLSLNDAANFLVCYKFVQEIGRHPPCDKNNSIHICNIGKSLPAY